MARRMAARGARFALLFASCMLAGQGWAGEAWRAEYEVRDGDGTHVLVIVRDDRRIEYREQDAPLHRLWRRTDDGIERTEVFPGRQAAVVSSPGDLRTMGEMPEWDDVAELVPASLREGLKRDGRTRRLDLPATRYSGSDAQGRRVALEWLDEVGLPASYRVGTGRDRRDMTLRALQRIPADAGFTALADLRLYDRADLGDMPLDPFARDYLGQFGKHRHGH